MADEYTCAMCGGTFEKAWSDDEARAEFAEEFPEASGDDAEVVCDDCYRQMMGFTVEDAPMPQVVTVAKAKQWRIEVARMLRLLAIAVESGEAVPFHFTWRGGDEVEFSPALHTDFNCTVREVTGDDND